MSSARHSFVARGSGTGLSGGALVDQEALLVITSRMRQVLEVDLDNQRVTVQPGVINSWVTEPSQEMAFITPPILQVRWSAASAEMWPRTPEGSIGLKYGVTSNHVLGLEVVLPTAR
ncbi:MAG: hypothetical protein CM15mP77_3940 [Synechococcus sp.]|nr:MAG: hypothetical protein CM15mP77_3940 [Synechococcus sp.]